MKKIQYFIITKLVGLYINLISIFHPEKAKQIAYTIFSQPRKGKIKNGKLPKTLQSAEQETLTSTINFGQSLPPRLSNPMSAADVCILPGSR